MKDINEGGTSNLLRVFAGKLVETQGLSSD